MNRMELPRRKLLLSALAAAAMYAMPTVPLAQPRVSLPSDSTNRRFSIFYKGDRIGAHTVSTTGNGEMRVTTDIKMVVKVLFLTVFSFSTARRNTGATECWFR